MLVGNGGVVIRKMKRGIAVLVPSVHLGPSLQQGRDDGGVVVAAGCKVQRGVATPLPRIHIGPSSEARPSPLRAWMYL